MIEEIFNNNASPADRSPAGQRDDSSGGSSRNEMISAIHSALSTIRERVDRAYNHICMDLPEINMEIYRTFQQAIDSLDSLSVQGSSGRIETVVEEIEKSLQGVLQRISYIKKYDLRILEIINQSEQHLQTAQNTLNQFEIETPDKGYFTKIQEYREKRSEFSLSLQQSLCVEDNTMNEIRSRISKDVRSLEYSLSSAVIILKDLISRSGAMKVPILKIMSGLQTHDIVNQDMDTVFRALSAMETLMNEKTRDNLPLNHAYFQARTSTLCRSLVLQLFDVVRRHGISLEQEIEEIEDMISQVKEDKDAIGEFLLLNKNGKSTFDIVLCEVTAIFDDLAEKIKTLLSLKETQHMLANQFCSYSDDLDRYATSHASRELPPGTFDTILNITSPIKAQARMIKYGGGINDLQDDITVIDNASLSTITKLEEIKDLLIGSIKGIDTYSGRCLDAITRFKKDIQNLMATIDESDHIIDNLEGLESSLASVPDEVPVHEPLSRDDSLTQEMHDILHRLETPHSNSLAEQDTGDSDQGLTLF